jgi:hypothetical protein
MPHRLRPYALHRSRRRRGGALPADVDTARAVRLDVATGLRREVAHAEAWALYAALGAYLLAAEGADRSAVRVAVAAVRLAWRAGVSFGRLGK